MKVLMILLLLLPLKLSAQKQFFVGNTWPIAEPDPIVLAKQRAKQLDKSRLTPTHSYRTRLAAKNVGRVVFAHTRYYKPLHTLEQDVYRPDGTVLYPAGFQFNFLEYMPPRNERILIIDEQDAQAVKPWLKPTDIVIVNQGDLDKVTDILKTRVAMLDLLTASRIDIKRVPALITIENHVFVIREFLSEQGEPL